MKRPKWYVHFQYNGHWWDERKVEPRGDFKTYLNNFTGHTGYHRSRKKAQAAAVALRLLYTEITAVRIRRDQ